MLALKLHSDNLRKVELPLTDRIVSHSPRLENKELTTTKTIQYYVFDCQFGKRRLTEWIPNNGLNI